MERVLVPILLFGVFCQFFLAEEKMANFQYINMAADKAAVFLGDGGVALGLHVWHITWHSARYIFKEFFFRQPSPPVSWPGLLSFFSFFSQGFRLPRNWIKQPEMTNETELLARGRVGSICCCCYCARGQGVAESYECVCVCTCAPVIFHLWTFPFLSVVDFHASGIDEAAEGVSRSDSDSGGSSGKRWKTSGSRSLTAR